MMRQQVNPGVVVAIIVVVILILGFLAFRKFGSNPSSGPAISPQQAGLGKPMMPRFSIQTGAGTTPAPQSSTAPSAQPGSR